MSLGWPEAALLFALATTACSEGGPAAIDGGDDASVGNGFGPLPADPLASDASLGTRASQILGGCQGGPESACHALGAGGTHLRLGPSGDLIDVPSTERPELARVAPGRPDASYVYLKVLGDGGIDGGRMPLGGPFDARLAPFIASWIEAGAPAP